MASGTPHHGTVIHFCFRAIEPFGFALSRFTQFTDCDQLARDNLNASVRTILHSRRNILTPRMAALILNGCGSWKGKRIVASGEPAFCAWKGLSADDDRLVFNYGTNYLARENATAIYAPELAFQSDIARVVRAAIVVAYDSRYLGDAITVDAPGQVLARHGLER